MGVSSAMTMTPAEPSIEPAAATESKSIATSISSGRSSGDDNPPGMTAFRLRPDGRPPAASKMSSRRLVPTGRS